MGGENSKPQASPSVSHVSLTLGAGEEGEYPFIQRGQAAAELLAHVTDARDVTSLQPDLWRKTFILLLDSVKKTFLISESLKTDEQHAIVTDKTSCDLVSKIEKLATEQPITWQHECENVCRVLCSHISAPEIPGKIPDTKVTNLVQLNLVNIRVKSQQGLSGLMTILQKNKSLETIEFGFTGMQNDLFLKAFSHIQKLQRLVYLGLRGNRLSNAAVSTLQKSLKSTKTLPRLMWVDLANNTDIVSLPLAFLNLMKQRWPLDMYHPTYRELLDDKVVLHKSQFVLMV